MIISFYSYKGGVGRTQLTANLASYLCYYKQRKVLIIDWDMEAPGVDFFFNIDRTVINLGLLDLFNEFVKTVRNKENIEGKDLPKIFYENNSKYLINLIKSEKSEGRVDLIPAGNYNDNFVKKVTAFDWFDFYDTLNGKYFIEYLKEELNNSDYDYIFIDSRTGTSDYAGICNIQFPELNVFVVAPTNQNFKGCIEIANSIINSPYVKNGLRKPIIMPILSRLDRTDKISGEWFGKFRETFKDIILTFIEFSKKNKIDKISERDKEELVSHYIDETLLEYKTEISYGERILFYKDLRRIEYTTLEKQIVEVANHIEFFNINIQKSFVNEIKSFVEKGLIEEAIRQLHKYSKDTSLENDSIMLLSRYNNIQKEFTINLITMNEYKSELSKLSFAILNLLNDYYKDDKVITLSLKDNRRTQLTTQIEMLFVLLQEWETKQMFSDNPTEKKRSEIEIKRIKETITIYENELYNIDNE